VIINSEQQLNAKRYHLKPTLLKCTDHSKLERC